jgi:hypothetical protein
MASGLYFSVSFKGWVGLDEVAREVSSALGVPLTLCEEPGLRDDYEGELIGLHLWLLVAEMFTDVAPARFSLLGGPRRDKKEDEDWLDIGSYMAEFLAERTGRPWEARRVSSDSNDLEVGS